MGENPESWPMTSKLRRIHGNKPQADELRDEMGKSDRKALVLQYLVHTRLALPTAVLYRNMRLRQNATFSESTLKNYLSELEKEGLIKRVDPEAMTERKIVEVADGRGYWMATESGREQTDGSFSFM
ncbi:transcriptional regulator [Halorubrum virus V_ICIS4]|nr:transcriptional regulator [Halorubrum virus V_ICIS4]